MVLLGLFVINPIFANGVGLPGYLTYSPTHCGLALTLLASAAKLLKSFFPFIGFWLPCWKPRIRNFLFSLFFTLSSSFFDLLKLFCLPNPALATSDYTNFFSKIDLFLSFSPDNA